MTLNLDPQLQTRLVSLAQESGKTPEEFVIGVLQEQIMPRDFLDEPQDEWERALRALAVPCGVSLSNEALGREELYD